MRPSGLPLHRLLDYHNLLSQTSRKNPYHTRTTLTHSWSKVHLLGIHLHNTTKKHATPYMHNMPPAGCVTITKKRTSGDRSFFFSRQRVYYFLTSFHSLTSPLPNFITVSLVFSLESKVIQKSSLVTNN